MTTQQEQKYLRLQLEAQGISDRRVLDAIEQTHRDLFVPEEFRNRAYENNALPIGEGQTISQPFMVAIMTQELALTGTEKVLEIGTGAKLMARGPFTSAISSGISIYGFGNMAHLCVPSHLGGESGRMKLQK